MHLETKFGKVPFHLIIISSLFEANFKALKSAFKIEQFCNLAKIILHDSGHDDMSCDTFGFLCQYSFVLFKMFSTLSKNFLEWMWISWKISTESPFYTYNRVSQISTFFSGRLFDREFLVLALLLFFFLLFFLLTARSWY